MDFSRLENALKGVAVTIATPFTKDLAEINTDAISMNLKYLLERGVKLVIPCGNTGEFYSLSEPEWAEVVEAVITSVERNVVVMPGVGQSVKTAINQIRKSEELGGEGIMVMYPQHIFKSEEGILAYYRTIIKTSKNIGVVLYKKGPLLSDAVLAKLFAFENIIGVKYAYGRIVDFSRTVYNLGKPVIWSCGTAERFAPFYWLASAEGFTSGLANFAPKMSLGMYDALLDGNFKLAMRLHAQITSLEDLREGRQGANNVPIVKALMDHVGLIGGDCRPPIHPLTKEERATAIESVKGWDIS